MPQDPLQHIPVERWPDLQSVMLSDHPRSIPGYNVLLTQTRWKESGHDYGFQVYCPYGDLRNGFVAVNDKPSSYDIVIQCPKDDTNTLEEALKTTKMIQWKKDNIKLSFAAPNVIECVQKVIKEKDIEMKLTPSDMLYTYVIEKDSPLFEDISLPPGFTFELLSSEHLDLIDSTWPHHHSTSLYYFQLLVDSKSGYGLFKDGKLIGWILIGECGNLTHLYTLEEHRKKGYAQLILKLISNVILKTKGDVFGFCVNGNERACKLYEKFGFKKTGNVFWPDLDKKK